MTADERNIMQQHIAYWSPYLNDGTLIVFGPVMDPKGGFGIAVIAVDNEEPLKQNCEPAILQMQLATMKYTP